MKDYSNKVIVLLKSLKSYERIPKKEKSDLKYWVLILLIVIIGLILIKAIPNIFLKNGGLIQITSHELFIIVGFIWPLLLVTTWSFERKKSIEKNCYRFISPTNLTSSIIWGEAKSFIQDKYYHIFQFVWIPFSIVMLFILYAFSRLYHNLLEIIDSAFLITYFQKINAIINSPLLKISSFSDCIMNERFIIITSVMAGMFLIISQIRIQLSRIKTGFDLYWWDFRIDKLAYIIRLIMVGIDGTLAVYLFLKLITISVILYDIIGMSELKIDLFSYGDYGGQETIVKIYWLIALVIFIFGIFSITTSYYHKRLSEYRLVETLVMVFYAVISIGMIVMPMNKVYYNIEIQKRHLIVQLNKELKVTPSNETELKKLNEYFTYINTIKNIKSSMFNLKTIFSPFLLLILQFVYFLWQIIFPRKNIDAKNILFSK